MAQSAGHVHHHPLFQYDCRKTENCKIFHIIKMKAVVSPLLDTISTKFQRLYLFWGPAIHWNFWEYCAIKPEVKNARWRPLNFKCMYLGSQTKDINEIATALHPCFGVQHSNGTGADTVQPNRKWIIQDGGHLTSNACISAPRQDRYEMLTDSATIPMFWGSSNPLELVKILCDQTGSGKIKDGGHSTSNACISASRQDINEVPIAGRFRGPAFH